MKKLLLLPFVALFFSACGGADKDYIHVQPQSVSMTGILEVQQIDAHPAGTHVLQKSDGEEMAVKSLSINLSNDRYLGNMVEVIGIMDHSNDVLEITGITVLEILAEPPVEEDVEKIEDEPVHIEEDPDDPEDHEFGYVGDDEDVSDEKSDEDPAEDSALPAVDMPLTTFKSLPYFFSGTYPSQWYYAGSLPTTEGVLHHYGFSDESPVTPENEIVSLDVVSSELMADWTSRPGIDPVVIEDQEFFVSASQTDYVVFTSVGGRIYRVMGPLDLEDLILAMAASIQPFEPETE